MIIKKAIAHDPNLNGGALINYEVVLQGQMATPFVGTVVVHDPRFEGGRKRGFLLPEGAEPKHDHVVICRIAIK